MIRAYNELYLSDAQEFLASAFDYALIDCKIEPNLFESIFARSSLCSLFEKGDPIVVSGKAGVEAIKELLSKVIVGEELPEASFRVDRSDAYWLGWSLAYYQWYKSRSFKDIFSKVPLIDILSMYKIFHEMDLIRFVEALDIRYDSVVLETNLKRIRKANGLSQSKLATLSGVTKRSIQLYEQRVNEIDKAQGNTLYKLSKALNCSIEDLLENPLQ